MKYLIIIVLTFTNVFAAKNSLMRCLGKEEQTLHKEKNKSFQYKLNQDVISALIQLHDQVVLRPIYFKKACDKDVNSPSFEILKYTLIYKENAYLNLLGKKTLMYGVANKSINELYMRMTAVFIDYLANIRANAPTKDCITDHIPGLKNFYEKMLYLQEDIPTEKILDSITDLHGVFIKLEYVNSIYKKCASLKKQ